LNVDTKGLQQQKKVKNLQLLHMSVSAFTNRKLPVADVLHAAWNFGISSFSLVMQHNSLLGKYHVRNSQRKYGALFSLTETLPTLF